MKLDNEAELPSAMSNWKAGHRLMFFLMRELTRSLKALEQLSDSEGPLPTAAKLSQLRRFTSIGRACAISFKIAGSIRAIDYDEVVVPSMISVHPAFTGLWSRDHSAMLQQLPRTFRKTAFTQSDHSHVRFIHKSMLRQHEAICALFAQGRSSLNTQNRDGDRIEGLSLLRDHINVRHQKKLEAPTAQ